MVRDPASPSGDGPPALPETAVASRQSRRAAFAEQELRLISSLVVILGLGLFLALPFVLSIGSVVFLPVMAALVLTVVLSPLADKINGWGVPNALAAFISILVALAVFALALALILQPAALLIDEIPSLANTIGDRFEELRREFAWIGQLNEQFAKIVASDGERAVRIATPSLLEEAAFATPSVVLETVLTLLMTYFMVEARIRLRERLLFGRASFGTSIKAARVLREVQDRVAAYILTVGFVNIAVGVIVALGAWAMGLGAPIMWGGLAALFNFLPYVGPIAMLAMLTLYGIGTADSVLLGLVPAAAYLALHSIEANVVTPSILGARFTMNPVLILIALSYFTWVWGVIGALLSVPILLMLTALFEHVGRPNLIGFIFGEPLFPEALDAAPAEAEAAPQTGQPG